MLPGKRNQTATPPVTTVPQRIKKYMKPDMETHSFFNCFFSVRFCLLGIYWNRSTACSHARVAYACRFSRTYLVYVCVCVVARKPRYVFIIFLINFRSTVVNQKSRRFQRFSVHDVSSSTHCTVSDLGVLPRLASV